MSTSGVGSQEDDGDGRRADGVTRDDVRTAAATAAAVMTSVKYDHAAIILHRVCRHRMRTAPCLPCYTSPAADASLQAHPSLLSRLTQQQ